MDDKIVEEFIAQFKGDGTEEPAIVAPLKDEIDLIFDPKLKALVIFLLSLADPFWDIPVAEDDNSSYYPEDEYEPGGLVLHIKRTIQTFMILESGFFSYDEKHAAIAALLLKNITKAVYVDSKKYCFDPFHLYTVDTFVTSALSQAHVMSQDIGDVLGADPEMLALVFRLIRTGYGPDSFIPETIPSTEIEKLLYYVEVACSALKVVLYEEYDDDDDD